MTLSLKSRQRSIWTKTQNIVEKITDRLGRRVDRGIKETVVAFMVHGFPTDASCEGHLNRALPYPWVDIGAPEPKDWRDNKKIKKVWERQNLKHQQRMLNLLAEFYKNRTTPFETQLSFDNFICGTFRIQSRGGAIAEELPPKQRKQKLLLYRKEMRDFTNFLKDY